MRAAVGVVVSRCLVTAQDRAAIFDRYQQIARAIPTSVRSGRVTTTWIDNDAFAFVLDGQRFRYS